MAITNYNDPLIITWYTDNSGNKINVHRQNQSYKIINNKIILSEIPDEFLKINTIIINNTIIYENKIGTNININNFVVNYTLGEITIDPSYNGETVTIPSWYARGVIKYPASRIELEDIDNLYGSQDAEGAFAEMAQRVNNLITEAEQPSEVVDARVSGITSAVYPILKNRLDTEYGEVYSARENSISILTYNSLKERLDGDYGEINGKISNIRTNYIFGMEYMRFFHDKIRINPVQSLKIIFTGDSTTYGTSIIDSRYKINVLCKSILNKLGVFTVESINSAHEGIGTGNWIASYLNGDLAQTPDLYIIRYGINDGSLLENIRLETFTSNLRAGLATIRAAKTPEQLSIILMMPNSTNDDPNGRNAEWYEQILPVVKQAARDYQCCFIDTYNYLLDSTNVVWEDDMASDGVHIHPLEIGNVWIASLMTEVIIPEALRNYGVTHANGADLTKLVTDAPSTYPLGVSIYRCGEDFPYDGLIETIFQGNGVLLQINSGYQALNTETIAIRRGLSSTGVPGGIGDNAWSPWLYIQEYEVWNSLTLQNSWVDYGSPYTPARYAKDKSGNVNLQGMIKDGTITADTIIAALPEGYRPAHPRFYPVVSNGNFGSVRVSANGNIQTVNIPSNVYVDFGNIIFKAEL